MGIPAVWTMSEGAVKKGSCGGVGSFSIYPGLLTLVPGPAYLGRENSMTSLPADRHAKTGRVMAVKSPDRPDLHEEHPVGFFYEGNFDGLPFSLGAVGQTLNEHNNVV